MALPDFEQSERERMARRLKVEELQRQWEEQQLLNEKHQAAERYVREHRLYPTVPSYGEARVITKIIPDENT